jgi:ABC-type transport system involved in cytochrome c biogenesis ATPase subunit
VLGTDLVHDRRAVGARVGLLGHSNGLYEDLTVTENIRFWARSVGAGADEVDRAVARLDLSGRLADAPVSGLSAGQRRRTALAALVVRRPELWLLDEPHAGLDAEGRDLVDELLRTAAAAGATVVVASHEQDRAGALAGRRVLVEGGRTHESAPEGRPAGPVQQVAAIGVVPC